MTDYRFPRWRQLPFVAVLIVILVLSYAPSITQGTLNVRIYAQIPQGVVSHLFVSFSYVQLHTAGFSQDTGFVSPSQTNPSLDLVPIPGQFIPKTILSTTVTSGRYDSIRLIFANSTLILSSGHKTPVSGGPTLTAAVTIPIVPNGNGDVLVLLSLDYSLLVSTPPTISASISQVTAVP